MYLATLGYRSRRLADRLATAAPTEITVRMTESLSELLALIRDQPSLWTVLLDQDEGLQPAAVRLARDFPAVQLVGVEGGTVPTDSQRVACEMPIDAALEVLCRPTADFVMPTCGDPRMKHMLSLARQFARSDASVLITGESGTGKEVLARFIHAESGRTHGAFVSVNCAAIPDNLLESELFGHEKGAFTGAIARRVGKFEEANGGTLLLDEITEMEPRLQAKLLRAIQEREIERLGGGRPFKVDIRLIATSNRDLEQAVSDGLFREDLFFRLNVVSLEVPALRERPLDIDPLARHFAAKFAADAGRPAPYIDSAAMARLSAHPWRGNVRELENCMHRAVLLTRKAILSEADIVFQHHLRREIAQPAPLAEGFVARTIAQMEQDLIAQTMAYTSGNRTHAANLLGISIRTLRNKLREQREATRHAPADIALATGLYH